MGSNFLVTFCLYSCLLALTGTLVNQTVPSPYMDEIFHVPQAQAYCAGNFTHWDPKITTLPGLYILSVGLLKPVHQVVSWWERNYPLLTGDVSEWPPQQPALIDLCSTSTLRTVNLIFSLVNLLLIYTLTTQIHGDRDYYCPNLGLWSSVNMALLPVLQFSSFLYYTDPASTTLVLLLYSLHLQDRQWLSAATGLLAILLRQTNIIWVLLMGMKSAGDILLEDVRHHQAETKIPPYINLKSFSGQLEEVVLGTREFLKCPKRIVGLFQKILKKSGGYLCVGFLFLGFITWNGSIVVGDKSAHEAVVHLPQILYFSLFTAGLTLPFSVTNIKEFIQAIKKHWCKMVIGSFIMAFIIHVNTMAHPYLLADNRHYTFYIWRKIIVRHWTLKFLLIPAYIFSLFFIGRTLERTGIIFKLSFPVCLVVSLVPQKLLELRYFIVPFLLTRLHVRPNSKWKIVIESFMMFVINVITIWLFLQKPFTWEHEPDQLQRFMW